MMKFLLLAAVVLWLFYSPGVRKLMRSLRTGEPAASPPACRRRGLGAGLADSVYIS
jgi:hypothetical protein